MKRAEVFKSPSGGWVCAPQKPGASTEHPTYAEALAHALAEVGLTEKETSR